MRRVKEQSETVIFGAGTNPYSKLSTVPCPAVSGEHPRWRDIFKDMHRINAEVLFGWLRNNIPSGTYDALRVLLAKGEESPEDNPSF